MKTNGMMPPGDARDHFAVAVRGIVGHQINGGHELAPLYHSRLAPSALAVGLATRARGSRPAARDSGSGTRDAGSDPASAIGNQYNRQQYNRNRQSIQSAIGNQHNQQSAIANQHNQQSAISTISNQHSAISNHLPGVLSHASLKCACLIALRGRRCCASGVTDASGAK